MEAKQLAAVIEILSFLATIAVLAAVVGVTVFLNFLGEERLSRWSRAVSGWLFGGRGLTRKLGAVAALLFVLYATVLIGASAASREWTLSPGEEKYFCEIDCHLAYSIAGTEKVQTVGAGSDRKAANGTFLIVKLRTRFDQHTISPRRGDSPLTPSPRAVTLVDGRGHEYPVSRDAQQALEASLAGRWTPLTNALRPGESYVTPLVFELPAGASGLKLLIASPTQPKWLGRVLIGDEGSILHKKVYLRLQS
jgi:hypothetical protein